MKLSKAMQALHDGKKIKLKNWPEGFLYLKDGIIVNSQNEPYNIYLLISACAKNHGSCLLDPDIDFEIYEESAYTLDDAFKDLRELYNHSLVALAEDKKTQYFLAIEFIKGELAIVQMTSHYIEQKLTILSPFFNNAHDIDCAVSEIGVDKIIKMFKRLKGIE